VRVRDAQVRLLLFVGRLGPLALSAIPDVTKALKAESQWSNVQHRVKLRVNVPVDEHIELDVIELIPKLVQLSTTGSNKQVRASALESLHACLMAVVG